MSAPPEVGRTAVCLTFDALCCNIRLARLVASGLMVERRFTVDEIEDVRIAVDEICALLVHHAQASGRASSPDIAPTGAADAGGATIELTFRADVDVIAVDGFVRPVAFDPFRADLLHLDPLTNVILEATVDEHRIEHDGTTVRVALVKTRDRFRAGDPA